MLWRLFQALVMILVGWGVVWLIQNEDFPDNGYMTGLIMVGAAWLATWLLSRCADLLRLRRSDRSALSEGGGNQGTLPGG